MSQAQGTDEENELNQDLDSPSSNEQLRRFMGSLQRGTQGDAATQHLVHQDVMFFGTDFP